MAVTGVGLGGMKIGKPMSPFGELCVYGCWLRISLLQNGQILERVNSIGLYDECCISRILVESAVLTIIINLLLRVSS